ncbi:2-oxo acid dehydrogenase subunit E2 [Geobacter sp.]|uniref:2-oxo acid dehydrogenase subunit E2 n=1 Tax=Geobacter sp. TaxID=46610 RepID=UPI0027B9C4EB|nr:2-oxo acid dehydrogenase subunit E2 [Geobacter sp.]
MQSGYKSASSEERYEVRNVHKYFDVNATIVEREIKPGATVTFSSEVDLSEIEEIRSSCADGYKPSYTAFVAKAVALALKEFPYANRRILRAGWLPFLPARMQQFNTCDIAVACERNLEGIEVSTFIDILRDSEKLSLFEITEWLHDLARCNEANNKQWRDYKKVIFQAPSWFAKFIINLPVKIPKLWSMWRGGAVIISSPAKYGVDAVVGAWMNPLGVTFGIVKKRPTVKNDEIVVCPTFIFSLNFDRRVMAGAQAARFFQRIIYILEHASTELACHLGFPASRCAGQG